MVQPNLGEGRRIGGIISVRQGRDALASGRGGDRETHVKLVAAEVW